tara:strand:- start:216 stop:1523 length:1308 start_codon:yes stop_codon:yes gene_type:complete
MNYLAAFFWIILFMHQVVGYSQVSQSPKQWLEVDIGIVGAASDEILKEALEQAISDGYEGLLITLDTPGGALNSTRSMVKRMMSADIPVVVWVGPAGSRAGSAGAFLTLAAHVAAMAPGTNIGAAHPIQASGQDIEGEAAKKVENDAVAFMDSIAEARGRNKEMAASFVINSVSITAKEALENKVIDLLAQDTNQLFTKLNGRVVTLGSGKEITLTTNSATRIQFEKNTRHQFLEILSDPNIFYLLFIGGIIGIVFELTHPGSIVPGVLGGIALVLAMIATSILPVSIGAMVLILISIAFMVAEIFVPSLGILGIGGFIGFVIGSVLLVDPDNAEGLRISWYSIVPGSAALLGFGGVLAWLVIQSETNKVISGSESIIGLDGKAISDFSDGKGRILIQGENWIAIGQDVKAGDVVRVTGRKGLELSVVTIHDEKN